MVMTSEEYDQEEQRVRERRREVKRWRKALRQSATERNKVNCKNACVELTMFGVKPGTIQRWIERWAK